MSREALGTGLVRPQCPFVPPPPGRTWSAHYLAHHCKQLWPSGAWTGILPLGQDTQPSPHSNNSPRKEAQGLVTVLPLGFFNLFALSACLQLCEALSHLSEGKFWQGGVKGSGSQCGGIPWTLGRPGRAPNHFTAPTCIKVSSKVPAPQPRAGGHLPA